MSPNVREVEGTSWSFFREEHNGEFHVGTGGYHNEEGYDVEYDQIHRHDDNRFSHCCWFEGSDDMVIEDCSERGVYWDESPTPQSVFFNIEAPSNQTYTTFSDYWPNETQKSESNTLQVTASFGVALGYGPLSVGLSLGATNDPDEYVEYIPYEHLELLTDDLGNSLPWDQESSVGFETDIVADSDRDEIDYVTTTEFDYRHYCGSEGYIYSSAPDTTTTLTLEVVN